MWVIIIYSILCLPVWDLIRLADVLLHDQTYCSEWNYYPPILWVKLLHTIPHFIKLPNPCWQKCQCNYLMPVQRANHDPVAKGTKVLLEKGSHMPTTWPPCAAPREQNASSSRAKREHLARNMRAFTRARTRADRHSQNTLLPLPYRRGVTRGVATEVNV